MKIGSTVLALGAASTLAVAAAVMPVAAYAADLGGNCCADLEERVAELEATTARKGNRKVSLTVYGHINEAILWHDIDGIDRKMSLIDNENSASRFGFRGKAAFGTGWTAGFVMEFGIGKVLNGDGDLDVRHSALYIASKQFGVFWLGKTSTATDGIVEMSLAGNTASTLGSWSPFGDYLFRQNLAPSPFNAQIKLTNPMDGGRTDVIKYVSPIVAGFSLSAAYAPDSETWDAALRYAGEFGGFRVASGIGYRDENESSGREFVGGSISVMHVTSGLFVDAAAGQSKGPQSATLTLGVFGINAAIPLTLGNDGTKVTFWGARLGIKKRFVAAGATQLYVEYQEIDINQLPINPAMWGVGVVQSIDAAALELYATYQHWDLDMGSGSDANVLVAGAKIKF